MTNQVHDPLWWHTRLEAGKQTHTTSRRTEWLITRLQMNVEQQVNDPIHWLVWQTLRQQTGAQDVIIL